MPEESSLVPSTRIESAILVLRGEKVILDSDVAALYEVETKALVQAMKRNLERFRVVFDALRHLMEPSGVAAKRVGFE